MKIAVCISGHLRDGDVLTYPSLKKFLLDKYECDVFVSSWKESGKDIQFVHNDSVPFTGEDMTSRILSTYKPISYSIEDASASWIENLKKTWRGVLTRNGSQLFQNNCMFRKIYDANRLRSLHQVETGKVYDCIVRLRFDTELVCDIIEESTDDILNGKLVVRSGHCGIVDQIFWGDDVVMDEICSCYLYLPRIVASFNSKSFENAENILHRYLLAKNIKFMVRDDIKFSLTKPHGKMIL